MISFPKELKQLGTSFLITADPLLVANDWTPLLTAEVGLANFWGGFFNSVGIDDVRNLKLWHSQKSTGGKYGLLAAPFFTREAQTALLKITEEPNDDTVILVITKNPNDLLGTLRSRLIVVTLPDLAVNDDALGLKFWQASPAERLVHQDKFIDLDADNHREQLLNLIGELKALIGQTVAETDFEAVKVINQSEKYAKVTGLSAKNAYEYLATMLKTKAKDGKGA